MAETSNLTLASEEDFKLFNLTDVDRATLRQTDEEYVPHDWQELKTIVANNDLSAFKRYPTALRRYLTWSQETKAKYGGIVDFVCQERLHWARSQRDRQQITPRNPAPFAHPDDFRILRNDWPYATEPDVAHMVVWLKTKFKVDGEGHILPESRAVIQRFVDKTFVAKLAENHKDAKDRVLWFKNWSALQSVGALEHFHVFVRGAREETLRLWTGEGPRKMM